MSLALRVTQPAPACSEQDLVAAVRRGNDRAFEELYARYRSRIGSYIFGMVGDHGRAEDIAQEVFISALRRLRETERTIIFKPWIYEIAKNACIDEFRRSRRIHEVPLEPEDDRESPAAALPSTSPTPDAVIESKQRLTDLTGAFRGLSESHHRILVLRELEGLSYNQIGARLGMSKPVVESTLFRARRRLGEEFEELESGRRCTRVQSMIASAGERPLRSLGIRERRQFARHVAHCELCLRQARDAGVEESLYHAPNLLGRLAVLAPIPWLRSVVLYLDPTSPGFGVGRAIATAAVVVAGAGAGGGLVLSMPRHPARLPSAVLVTPSVRPNTIAPRAASASWAPRRARRGGAAVVGLSGATGTARPGGLSSTGAASTAQLGASVSSEPPARGEAEPTTPGSPSGTGRAEGQPPAIGSPPGGGGSGASGTSQTAGGAPQPAGQTGGAGATAPSSSAGNPSGQPTGPAPVGVVLQGLGALTNGTAPAATAVPPASLPPLPAFSPNGSGSSGASNATSTPASPVQPAGSGGATSGSSSVLPGAIGQAGQGLPGLGPAPSS